MKRSITAILQIMGSVIFLVTIIIGEWGCSGEKPSIPVGGKMWDSGKETKPRTVKATQINGVLRIFGKGAMMDYDEHYWAPWRGRYSQSRGEAPFLFDSSALSITSVIIDEGVTHIGDMAFAHLQELRFVTIPSSVSSIGNMAFYGCDNLMSVTIPGNVKTVGEMAFCSRSLRSITIENGVTAIGKRAFSFCEGLTSITVPGSVVSIGDAAFSCCINLTFVTIEEGVTTIGRGAFGDCANLMSITIPRSVTSIGDSAFYKCANLASITIWNPIPPDVSVKAFDGLPSDVCLYVPKNGAYFYRDALSWRKIECVKPTAEAAKTNPFSSSASAQIVGGGDSYFTDPQNGKKYRTIKIGKQTWMAENLNDGYYCYDGDESSCETYGNRYSWDVAIYVCPYGWHLPSREEWKELADATGDRRTAGKKLKSKTGWNDDNDKTGNGDDNFKFSALPGGLHRRYVKAISPHIAGAIVTAAIDTIIEVGFAGYWWSATEISESNAFGWYMNSYIDGLHEYYYDKKDGLSVRCVKDSTDK